MAESKTTITQQGDEVHLDHPPVTEVASAQAGDDLQTKNSPGNLSRGRPSRYFSKIVTVAALLPLSTLSMNILESETG